MQEGVSVGQNVQIGKNCDLGKFVVIHDDTIIGDNVKISDFCVLGRRPMRAKRSVTTKDGALDPLVIEDGVMVGTGATIYRGSKIGGRVLVADGAQVRERNVIGPETIIGRSVTVENDCEVGARCKVETGAYITARSVVEDDCFIAPMVTFTNDPCAGRDPRRFDKIKGPHLKRGARIGANATILPGIVLEEDSFVAAGSVVTRNVPAKTVVLGSPAKPVKTVPNEQLLENQ